MAIEHAIESASNFSRMTFELLLSCVLARIKSLASPSESLTPGILYVGVATLSGSIIARNRTLATRLLLPPTLFIASMYHFLPKTTHNISAYFDSLEAQYFPSLAEKHRIGRAHTQMTLERIKEWTKSGREKFHQGVGSFVDRIQDFTELKIQEGLGWGPKRDSDVHAQNGPSKKEP
jgi:organizing structure protein 2